MTARTEEQDGQPGSGPSRASSPPRELYARLLGRPPDPIEVGAGTALLLDGTLEAEGREITGMRVRLGGIEQEVDAFGMPLPRNYGSGPLWWAIVAIPSSMELGRASLTLIAEVEGERVELDLGGLELVRSLEAPQVPAPRPSDPSAGRPIAICMATHEPRRDQLGRQLGSIREQTHGNWVCLISDDCSSEAALALLEEEIAGDPRFVLSRSPERLGFYRNFERSLRMVPADAELVALADQDDRWDPDKLEALASTLGDNPGAQLAYSDMRIATDGGEILSNTFWYLRRNSYDDIASLIVANTVTGAASIFRRELLDVALPFPPAQSEQEAYHDHWLALCALAQGEIAYLDRPTYDYTRHADSVTIRAEREWLAPAAGLGGWARLRLRRLTRRLRMSTGRPGWRAIYFDRYLLIRQLAAVLELRLGERIPPRKRRALRRLTAAEHSPAAAAWLLARSLRPLIGRNETLARERVLFGGVLWRRVVGRRARAAAGERVR